MPISKYFGGKGKKVMAAMKETYPDPKKAKEVFYATANKRGETPGMQTGGAVHADGSYKLNAGEIVQRRTHQRDNRTDPS